MAGSKGSKYFDIFLNYKFWLTKKNGTEILGKKVLSLLKDIDNEGSIQAAANKNNISYRKAWGDIKNAESILEFAITEKKRGGKDGGKTVLTEDGKNMLNAFDELEQEFDKAVYNTAKKFFHKLNKTQR
ncbi:MAG: LysR family transcriptional regulator [Bacteroidales bacterium]|nr:LysR family transcriptional regulator [Bacteroidales bacterium]